MTEPPQDPSDTPIRVALRDGRTTEIRFTAVAATPDLMQERGHAPGACLVVTDETVARLHLGGLVDALASSGWQPRSRVLPAGEASKSLRTLSGIYDWALAGDDEHPPLTRGTPVLALGGGVIGDVAAFAASTLLRGLPLVHLPTTLLAQVDSAIGGKTGIDHARGKNLIGTFYQPDLVVTDTDLLATLPRREWHSGLAEVIKTALVADEGLVSWLEGHWETLEPRGGAVREMVRRAASVKVEIVREDERERGRRAILNFGHTFGHAIERATEYLVYTHGEAVALGMSAAIHLSHELNAGLDRERAEALLARLPPPPPLDVPRQALNQAMDVDKKRTREGLRFVVLEEIGSATLRADVGREAIERAWDRITV